jgi:Transcriptional Coactivator p15 (PC4)
MVIGEFRKNTVELVKVSWEKYKGSRFIDIRAYFQNKDGEWLPTKKGIAIPKDKLESLIGLLRSAQKDSSEKVNFPTSTRAREEYF